MKKPKIKVPSLPIGKALNRVFPLPKYLNIPIAGIDISDESVKYIIFEKSKGGYIIKSWGEKAIPRGAVTGGGVEDVTLVSEVLSEIKKENKINFVAVSLPEEKSYLFKTKISSNNDLDIRDSLLLIMEEHVPLALNEIVFDYDILPPKEGKSSTELMVCAFSQDVIDSYLEALSLADLKPVSLELEASALAKALVPKDDNENYIVIDFGNMRTGVSVVAGQVVQYTATIPIGSSDITQAIMEELKISQTEAEQMKQEKGFILDEENEKIYSAIAMKLSALQSEIKRNLNYWQSHNNLDDKDIKQVLLCGRGSLLKGFREYTEKTLSVPTKLGDVWTNVVLTPKYVPEVDFNDSLAFVVAIGLALPDQKK